jgi:hypothetical protein
VPCAVVGVAAARLSLTGCSSNRVAAHGTTQWWHPDAR